MHDAEGKPMPVEWLTKDATPIVEIDGKSETCDRWNHNVTVGSAELVNEGRSVSLTVTIPLPAALLLCKLLTRLSPHVKKMGDLEGFQSVLSWAIRTPLNKARREWHAKERPIRLNTDEGAVEYPLLCLDVEMDRTLDQVGNWPKNGDHAAVHAVVTPYDGPYGHSIISDWWQHADVAADRETQGRTAEREWVRAHDLELQAQKKSALDEAKEKLRKLQAGE